MNKSNPKWEKNKSNLDKFDFFKLGQNMIKYNFYIKIVQLNKVNFFQLIKHIY